MSASPESQLEGFLAKYTPEIAAEARIALDKLRELLPGAIELVYDNYNALVIGFGPDEKVPHAILSLALYPKWLTIFFLQAVPTGLPDPLDLLQGEGTTVRGLRLENAATLDRPEVRDLIRDAAARAVEPLDESLPRRMVIKSISAKQRPRRPKE